MQSASWRGQLRSRGYLPHFESECIPQIVTFRLADSFPKSVLAEWEMELATIAKERAAIEIRNRIEKFLDKGVGALWLGYPKIAELTQNALLAFNGERYLLHSWVVMPNHVHVLITPNASHSLSGILHSWKSFTAVKANHVLGRTGAFWQKESFDRLVRDERHFVQATMYIEHNPVKAGLCSSPVEWRYSSANLYSRKIFHKGMVSCVGE